jgi:hypothetical protein
MGGHPAPAGPQLFFSPVPGAAISVCFFARLSVGITCAAGASNLFCHPLTTPPSPAIIGLEAISRDFGWIILLCGTHLGIKHIGPAKEFRLRAAWHSHEDREHYDLRYREIEVEGARAMAG